MPRRHVRLQCSHGATRLPDQATCGMAQLPCTSLLRVHAATAGQHTAQDLGASSNRDALDAGRGADVSDSSTTGSSGAARRARYVVSADEAGLLARHSAEGWRAERAGLLANGGQWSGQ